jgi:hypothetical protein
MNLNDLILAVLGGLLIGGGAALLLAYNGQVAGISGILNGLLHPRRPGAGWRTAFVVGLLVGGVVVLLGYPGAYPAVHPRSIWLIVPAGLLVGFGTRIGAGCTSGHGVCGIGRLSPRSVVATMTFTITGGVTVLVVNHLLGALT